MIARWGSVAAVVIAVVIRAATSPAERRLPLDEAGAQRAASSLAAEEPGFRKQALHDWAGDPWSADDHFAHLERLHAQKLANQLRVSEQEIFRAHDESMRNSGSMRATVAPCRPRPITD